MLFIFIKGSNRTLILFRKKDKKEKYILIVSKSMIHVSRDSKKLHINCVMCYSGIELQCAQRVLMYLLVNMSSAPGSQMKLKVLCTPLSGLVHMGCTLCQVFLWLDCTACRDKLVIHVMIMTYTINI